MQAMFMYEQVLNNNYFTSQNNIITPLMIRRTLVWPRVLQTFMLSALFVWVSPSQNQNQCFSKCFSGYNPEITHYKFQTFFMN